MKREIYNKLKEWQLSSNRKSSERYPLLHVRLQRARLDGKRSPLCSQSLCERFWHENALFLEKKVRKSAFSCHFKEKYRNFAVEPKH